MARIDEATLRVDGEGRDAVFTVDVQVDWDRGDRDARWELLVRFLGADAGLRGGDQVVKVHAMAVSPDDGDRLTVTVDNRDGVFDEDAGDDEVLAECQLHAVPPESEVVRTNKVTGRF